MILMLNNRDSFVFNLSRYLTELGACMEVAESDQITLDDLRRLAPQALVISPGPCTPAEAGISLEAIRAFAGRLPILGVCLGHQAIAAAYGWHIGRAKSPAHGRSVPMRHSGKRLFEGLAQDFEAGLYHSLIAEAPEAPAPLVIDAVSPAGEVMAISHERLPVFGVQFHPESILTPLGSAVLQNFLIIVSQEGAACSA